MILVTGSLIAPQEHRHRILEISREHCARSRAEPGCIAHNVHEDCETPGRLVFVEYWSGMDTLQAHFQVPASREFVRELRQLTGIRPEMRLFEANEVQP